jgi:chemotaxis protein CheX
MNSIVLDETAAPPAQSTLPIQFLSRAMVDSACEVFSTMLNQRVSPEEPRIRTAIDVQTDGVVALVGLTGEWAGTGVLSCSAPCACWMSNHFLMSDFHDVDDEVLDAVGEITNMVVGNFKNALAEKTGPLAMSIPAIVYGREMRTSSKGGGKEWFSFPFSCDGNLFEFLVRLQPAIRRASR